ncbi:MAG: protein translocase subunit SecF [Patescibacteria group bacterium]
MRYRIIYLFLSALVLVPGIATLFVYGLKPAIDFTGGTLMEFLISSDKNPTVEEIRTLVSSQQIEIGTVQTSGKNSFLLRLKPLESTQHDALLVRLNDTYGTVVENRYESVGPTLGGELLRKTFIAAMVALTAILLYVAWAFKNFRYGVSAILALLHDVLVVIGVFAILGKVKGVEVDALFVTAILTTMSFSVHDTIVVFDRIRELQKKSIQLPYLQVINQALTETMVRSLNNSLTIIFMLLALVLFGGETIRWFAVALLVGTITGTYSSPFVATPILYTWSTLRDKKNI